MKYESKDQSYYSVIRFDLINLIKKDAKNLKILEIGAAYGATLNYLKETGIASEVIGVDLFHDIENKERYKEVDRFVFGDIQEIDLDEYQNHFDIILLPDVLEHLLEPKPVLEKIKNYLKKDGNIIVSMPNIRHHTAIRKILFKGDFRYEESGIFDYTHIRFYCRKNIKELLESAGLKVVKQQGSANTSGGKVKIVNNLTIKIFDEFLSAQYYFVVSN